MIYMIFIICFATCFGIVFFMISNIDVGSMLVPFWLCFHLSRDRFVDDVSHWIFLMFLSFDQKSRARGFALAPPPFPSFSRPCLDFDLVLYFGCPLVRFNILFNSFSIVWTPCWLNVGRFGHLFDSILISPFCKLSSSSEIIAASNSNNYDCWHFRKLCMLAFQAIIIAGMSENCDC